MMTHNLIEVKLSRSLRLGVHKHAKESDLGGGQPRRSSDEGGPSRSGQDGKHDPLSWGVRKHDRDGS